MVRQRSGWWVGCVVTLSLGWPLAAYADTDAGPADWCGDGVANGWDEECDGSDLDGATCIDVGYTTGTLACSSACDFDTTGCSFICGDGMLDLGETCDDGNLIDGDGCSSLCETEPITCGDAVCDLTGAETCFNCLVDCATEYDCLCGNGVLDAVEGCDDGNSDDGDGCNALCRIEFCGDFVVQPSEDCDDGNTDDGDGCTASCDVEPASCNNGTCDSGETCGNCPLDCAATVLCTCGDGVIDPGEACDDGNTFGFDGCSSQCEVEEWSPPPVGTDAGFGPATPGVGCGCDVSGISAPLRSRVAGGIFALAMLALALRRRQAAVVTARRDRG